MTHVQAVICLYEFVICPAKFILFGDLHYNVPCTQTALLLHCVVGYHHIINMKFWETLTQLYFIKFFLCKQVYRSQCRYIKYISCQLIDATNEVSTALPTAPPEFPLHGVERQTNFRLPVPHLFEKRICVCLQVFLRVSGWVLNTYYPVVVLINLHSFNAARVIYFPVIWYLQ